MASPAPAVCDKSWQYTYSARVRRSAAAML